MTTEIFNFYQLNAAKGFKIVHLNIRSLPRKIDQLRAILENSLLDIVTLSETWLHSKIDSQIVHIKGYTLYRFDRKVSQKDKNKRGGGLIAYIKNGLDVRVHDSENVSTKDIEIQWLRITRNRAKDILLGNLYRPPNGKLG